ncbi:MAG: FecR domain-containing protein [Planctomycetales bacterium]|nr:FecR domain-containing protein [Planctomycetales bacterium]
MNSEERIRLIDSLMDGSICDADRLRIEAEMIVDAAVRREYYQRIQLEVMLEQEAAVASIPEKLAWLPSSGLSWTKLLSGMLITIAASVVLIVGIKQTAFGPNDTNQNLSQQPTASIKATAETSASGFAILNGQENAVWSDISFADGDVLPSGKLHLKSGLAHIELFSGVQVVLAGEARFTIDSPMQMTVLEGRARARVPEPAQGFKIKTNSGDVIDLGTEFSISVDPSGADVHVIDGEVELQPQASDSLRLYAGGSRRLSSSDGAIEVDSELIRTVGPREFQERARERQQQRYSQWSQKQTAYGADPRLVAYYRFRTAGQSERIVENLATVGESLATSGTIVGAKRTANRWGQTEEALDFSPVGSRVRVHVPDEFRGLTLLCWVKINSLDRWYNSLFLTDGHDDREPHWQLMDDGRVFFSVKVPREDEEQKLVQPIYYSPSIWNPSLSGRWTMLAVTYDVESRAVTHYLNGQPLARETIQDSFLVESIRVGHASICNWSQPMYRADPEFVLRNLNGTMDEFAMFAGALTADEIWQWYESGNPNE